MEAVAEGLIKNVTLRYLDLSSNKFNQQAMTALAECLGRTALRHLDLSCNELDDDGVVIIEKGL